MIFSLLVTKISNYVTIFFFILDARLKLLAIMANKKDKIRNRKRKFRGNQYITTATDQYKAAHNVTQTVNDEDINCSTSKRKLKHISETTRLAETECNSFFFFMHFKQLQQAFEKYANCQYCGAGLQLSHDEIKKMRFAKTVALKINFFLPQILNETNQG